jgi:DNA-binding PadR family transcriptional regulator
MIKKLIDKYVPMTETAYYILLALASEMHGYGIKGHVDDLTEGRLKLGAGTIYGTLSKMEKDGLIRAVKEYDRRRTYIRTETGTKLLIIEAERLREMVKNAGKGGIA